MTDSFDNQVHHLDIPVQIDIPSVVQRLRFRGGDTRYDDIIRELAEKAQTLARPRAIYKAATVHCAARDKIDIDGIPFTSRILGKLFYENETVYPFIATIGNEIDDLKFPTREMMKNFALDSIKTIILVSAVENLSKYLQENIPLKKVAFLNPGELEDWPITEQRYLFELFRGKEKQIGVSLTSGTAMNPIKSRSGIIFPDETGFLSCRLCTQTKCPGRRAAYDPEVVEEILS